MCSRKLYNTSKNSTKTATSEYLLYTIQDEQDALQLLRKRHAYVQPLAMQ